MARKPVVIVAGASKGIGLAVTSILLHKFGANVVALSRTVSQGLKDLASEHLLTIECDIADETSLINAITKGEEAFNHIDGLVLNAATLDPLCRIVDNTPLSAWRNHFEVNFFSLITAVRAALPALRKSELGGRVVFVSSGAATKGTAGWGPYNASKAAMNSLCRTLAEEEPNVTSIAVRPGVVDTAMQQAIRDQGSSYMTSDAHQMFLRLYADGNLLKSEVPGHVIAALALKASPDLSGQFISWDEEKCTNYRASE
ncbi:short-chain dehydrogenase [Moniliophthora roreri MCA 2997]|uniref:Short-chain dehydrogenase n=1 Tax=Moniliophthora roreri (strain MCA 2997) TaxID=1381753 RepID=V2XTA2_MONRO|nr:short-chain dehydrogenase [Moniliophthora roreri MCA 2997]